MWDFGLLILRVSFSATMLFGHGLGKLVNFSEKSATFADPIGLGPVVSLGLVTFAEFFCAGAVMLGLFTKYTVIPLIIAMSVAFFRVHAADPFAKKELAFLYLCGFIVILALGPGKYSIDKK